MATNLLYDADTGAKKQLKAAKSIKSSTRFPAGTEWELLHSDAVILHALTLALRYAKSLAGYRFVINSIYAASPIWATCNVSMN